MNSHADPVGKIAENKTVTLLFTNDLESAFDPITAFWREDIQHIGGIAQLATLIDQIRGREAHTFLFDAGDIFTGTLSKLTQGELPFELMMSMAYDAMAIGNHEFEYGWQAFARQKNRVSFPVLGANLFYKGTDHPYAQPFTIIERDGVRIGVIGILGQDAATALIPANIAGVEVRPPGPIVRDLVTMLKPQVDLVVLLTHQGKTAPMQTDDSANAEIQRDIEADIRLAGVVPGIDVLFAGHADAGTREPVVHPQTGTLIMQTFGQGTHLGFLQLVLDGATGKIIEFDGKLITVDSDVLEAHKSVHAKLMRYREQYAQIYEPVGVNYERLNRKYNQESSLGNLFADILRDFTSADIGLMPSGALRKDIIKGKVRKVDLLDAFPFTDKVALVTMDGVLLREILEQGLTLERGILQVSGLRVEYDPERPAGERLLQVQVGGLPLRDETEYQVATLEILAKGGDLYRQFLRSNEIAWMNRPFSAVLEQYFSDHQPILIPVSGRLMAVSSRAEE